MDSNRRWTMFALLGLAALLVSRLHLLSIRILDPDEFEHLHVGFCISIGLVPYRDFFEHHGPLTYYLAAPLHFLFGPDPRLLLANRVVSLILVAGTLTAVWRAVEAYGGTRNAFLACAWMATLPCFAEKSLEWRPDVSAMCALAWAAYFLSVSRLSGRFLIAGLCLGLAALCTQKVAFVVIALALSVALLPTGAGRARRLGLLALPLGIAVPWALCLFGFWLGDGLADLFRCLVAYPLRWPREAGGEAAPLVSLWRLMSRTQWAPGHYGLLAFAVVALLGRIRKEGPTPYAPVLAGLIVHLAALPLVPAVYLQYYLLVCPLAAMVVGFSFKPAIQTKASIPAEQEKPQVGGLLALLFALAFVAGGAWLQWPSLRPFFVGFPTWLPIVYGNLDAVCLSLLPIAVAAALLTKGRKTAVVWVVLLLPGVGRTFIPHWYWPTNHSQIAELRIIDEAAAPDEKVLDGFSGLGCLRPHAFYFWWINQHSLPLIRQERKLDALRETIRDGDATLIVLDPGLNQLRDYLAPAITSRYQPWKQLRRDLFLMVRDDKVPPQLDPRR